MPKSLSTAEFQPILDALAEADTALSVDEILGRLVPARPRRTVQRWLAFLVADGRLRAHGEDRGRRYFPSLVLAEPAEPWGASLSLSSEGRWLREQMQRSQSQRHPVGYQADFLSGYHPNTTFYLPQDLRGKLKSMGRTGEQSLPAGTHLRKVLDRLLIDLSWNSSRLEGNTYSLLETQLLLTAGEAAEGKRAEETQMILNHKAAIELLAEASDDIGCNRYTICSLHALLWDNLLPSPSSCGRLRKHAVSIGGSVFHPLELPQLIGKKFSEILAKAGQIEDAFERSFFLMVHLPYLQPFEDVNKRTSRLAANIPLIQQNLGPLSFVDVPEADYKSAILAVYELNRIEYLRDVYAWAYERSCARYAAIRQSLGEPDPFRLRHRVAIQEAVGDVVRGGLDKKSAITFLRRRASEVMTAQDRTKFIELAETELAGLHEGNFARFRIRPSEFRAWQGVWK